ncbi:Uncharacterised protein [uncultured archaeon]|nr:Uncharacterised protein [uncultured archaeon]
MLSSLSSMGMEGRIAPKTARGIAPDAAAAPPGLGGTFPGFSSLVFSSGLNSKMSASRSDLLVLSFILSIRMPSSKNSSVGYEVILYLLAALRLALAFILPNFI